MSEFKPGDSDICIQTKNAMQQIGLLSFSGRKNPAYAIERLGVIIASAYYEIKLLKEQRNDKA